MYINLVSNYELLLYDAFCIVLDIYVYLNVYKITLRV